MKNQLEISYENIGISSYLTVTFPSGAEVVGYQLEMITSNEISHLLAASKRVVDGETVIYYNISSRMALSQVLERRKVTRDEFIRMVEAAVRVGREVKEYQLAEECLVMEPDYIYVDPANCEPSFLYLPVIPDEEGGLKKFMLDMVMQGRIEMGGDNFIQTILEAVNAKPFSPDKLEACLEHFKGGRRTPYGSAANSYGSAVNSYGSTANSYGNAANSYGSVANSYGSTAKESAAGYAGAGSSVKNQSPAAIPEVRYEKNSASEELQNSAAVQEQPADRRPPLPAPPSESKGGGKKKEKTQKPQKAKKEKPAEFDSEQAKKKFLIPQAVVWVALAALVSFGAFKNEAGGIAVNNILAAALCVAVGEIILYREIYVNKKNGSKKENKRADSAKTGKGGRPKPPSRGNTEDQADIPRPAAGPAPKTKPQPIPKGEPQPAPRPVVMPSAVHTPAIPVPPTPVPVPPLTPFYGGMAETEIGGETELWDSSEDGMEAYLEYYENGLMTRIVINKSSTLVGRLQGQVDFAVTDPKVGKVHAEFINQDGIIYVKDLNSKNGTYLNGSLQRLNSNMMYPLKNNDRIALAKSEFVLHCSDGQG